MRMKSFLLFFMIYVLLFLSIFIFFNPAFMKTIPKIQIYDGELNFSGEEAYKKLDAMVQKYPQREANSKNNLLSAQWIEQEFKYLGFKTYADEFEYTEYMSNANKFFKNFMTVSLNSLITTSKGLNVYAVCEGKSNEIIVVGAHRDTIRTIEGAEDNGSGTAAMLELARTLKNKSHYYTYLFASFDAEEVGLLGSRAFVAKHENLPIKLAICLDVVGSKMADTIEIFQYTNSQGASPLWTTALSQKIAESMNKEMYYFIDFNSSNIIKNNSVYLFKTYFSLKTSDYVGTDSGSFYRSNIPAVGFIATKKGEVINSRNNFRQIHTPEDSFDKISPKTLEMVGRFTEKYIKSIENNKKLSLGLESKNYLIVGDRYIHSAFIVGFIAYITILYFLIVFLTYRRGQKNGKLLSFIFEERKRLMAVMILSFVSVCWWLLLKINFFRELPITVFIIMWFAIVTVITVVLSVTRKNAYRKDNINHEILVQQKVFLNILYFLVFVILGTVYNFFIAMVMVVPALLGMGRVEFTTSGRNFVRATVFIVLFILQIILSINFSLRAFKFDMVSMRLLLMGFLCVITWIASFVYGPASLFMFKRIKRSAEANIQETH